MAIPTEAYLKKTACSVPGCKDTISTRHRFPKRTESIKIFETWMARVNNPKLANFSRERIYRSFRVCDRHFDDDCKVIGWKKLIAGSLPTLHLPNFPPSDGDAPVDVAEIWPAGRIGQIDLPTLNKNESDPQMVDDYDILLNLNSFSLQVIDIPDTLVPISSEVRCRVGGELEQENVTEILDSNIEDFTEYEPDAMPLETEPQLFSDLFMANKEFGDIFKKKCADDVQIQEEPVIEKPYFKSVKSFLLGSNCITEVCRICFRSLVEEDIIRLYEETSQQDTIHIKNMLKLVLPDLDLEMYPNTVICTKCTELLGYSYQLKETWLLTEEKLQKIVEKKKGVTNRDADLVIVAKAMEEAKLQEPSEQVISNINLDHSYEGTDTIEKRADTEKEIRTITDSILRSILTNNKTSSDVSVFHGELNLNQHAPIKKRKPTGPRQGNWLWGLGPFVCEMCGGIYTKIKSFKRHLHQHAINKLKDVNPTKRKKPKQTMCEHCGQLFSTARKLALHSHKHAQDLRCATCNKEFKSNRQLQQHIRHKHLKIYNYTQCHLCGKQLSYLSSLRTHLLSHNPKKLYTCEICDKTFYLPSGLKKHLRKHSNEVRHCEYCGKSIKYEHSLEQHIKIYHLNQGQFVCEFCDKPYWKRVDLVKHRIRMHSW